MSKDQKIKVYNLEDIKTKKKIKGTDLSSSRIEEHTSQIVNHNVDGISDETYKILHTNPFLYNPNHQQLKIYSIEDYFIDVKKNSLPLGQVLRGKDFSIGKKNKYIKKAFKKWKKDFEESKDKVIKYEQEKNELDSEYSYSTISFMHYIYVALLMLLVSIIRFRSGLMWTNLGGSKWFISLTSVINDAMEISWFNVLSLLIIYISIVSILYINLYNSILIDLKKLEITRQKIYNHSDMLMTKEFKKKFKDTKKYYTKKSRSKNLNFSLLPIEKTAIKKVDLRKIEEMTEGFIKKTIKVKKNKFLLNTLKYLFVYMLYICGIVVFGYLIYLVVIKIF